MTKVLKVVLAFLLMISLIPISKVKAQNEVKVYFFYDDSCTHCYQEGIYLDQLEKDYSNLDVTRYEVSSNASNQELFESVKTVMGDQGVLTPYTVIGGVSLVGYNDQTKKDIVSMIQYASENVLTDVVQKVILGETVNSEDLLNIEDYRSNTIVLPLLGEVEINELSIGLAAVVIGFVDGFNPCAMWVLIFLITLLIQEKNKKKMWVLGSAFLLTSGIMYFLIMSAWLNVAIKMTTVWWIRFIIGTFALGFGIYHIGKYIKSLREKNIGCDVTTETQKKKILEKTKKIVLEQKMLIALLGIIALALSVNLVELACSAGLPLLFTQILAYNDLTFPSYYLYILLYILFFMIDDIIVFTIAMVTFQATGISNKYSKISTVVGAIIMIIIGVLLIFFPNIIMFNF